MDVWVVAAQDDSRIPSNRDILAVRTEKSAASHRLRPQLGEYYSTQSSDRHNLPTTGYSSLRPFFNASNARKMYR